MTRLILACAVLGAAAPAQAQVDGGAPPADLGDMAPVVQPPAQPAAAAAPSSGSAATPQPGQPAQTPQPGQPATLAGANPAPAQAAPPVVQMVPVGLVTSQSPEAGHRASKGSVVKLVFGHSSSSSQPAPSSAPSPAQ